MKRKLLWCLLALAVVATSVTAYVYTHPLVFNESFWGHAHCIPQAGMALQSYADQHNGRFPEHPDGYGNALLLLAPYTEGSFYMLTGPGYDESPFLAAFQSGAGLSEEDCGRVYIQGLTLKTSLEVAVMFDKLPSPGGDHCQTFFRLVAPLGREVLFPDGHHSFIPEIEWPRFASKQVELLVKEGIPRHEAERLYASKAKH
jgi:hypothetical protein